MAKYIDEYVIIQIMLLAAVIISTPYMHVSLQLPGILIGLSGIVSGLIIVYLSFKQLGAALTPSVHPLNNSKLITDGIYGLVRHPMYLGVILIIIGWAIAWGSMLSLFFSLLTTLFFMIKARKEEGLLLEKYPEYKAYQLRVKKRIVPFIY